MDNRSRWLFIGINVGAVVVAVAAFLLYRSLQPVPGADTTLEGTISQLPTYGLYDDVGFLPKPSQRITARRVAPGKVVYDVTYGIDANGFRVMPPNPPDPDACVVLFGDSNTFGIGVKDNETYAWQLAERGKGRVAVFNFGIGGSGPHQMLAGLQSGRYQKALTCTPTDVYYFFIVEHIGRATGRLAPWDPHGPRFRLGADGRPVRDGNFDTPPPLPVPDLDEGFLGWRRLVYGIDGYGTREEAALTAALMVESAREIARIAPKARFHVLFWTMVDDQRLDQIAQTLTAAGITVDPVQRIVPDYRDHQIRYVVGREDGHPNPKTHIRIADYLWAQIVANRRSASASAPRPNGLSHAP
ncbi:MAG: SGNH/GDSL hydrolase family protein [Proteobacteria bacterium]|nr:SGNH/GDSL hydrolase family protein [Pseudomonadota bacterium]